MPMHYYYSLEVKIIINGPPTQSVRGARLVTVAGVCRLSRSVTLHGGPAGGITRTV